MNDQSYKIIEKSCLRLHALYIEQEAKFIHGTAEKVLMYFAVNELKKELEGEIKKSVTT